MFNGWAKYANHEKDAPPSHEVNNSIAAARLGTRAKVPRRRAGGREH